MTSLLLALLLASSTADAAAPREDQILILGNLAGTPR